MVAVDNEPFYIIEHTRFMCLMALLERCYSLPSSTYSSEKLIPTMFDKVRSKVAGLKNLLALLHISDEQ